MSQPRMPEREVEESKLMRKCACGHLSMHHAEEPPHRCGGPGQQGGCDCKGFVLGTVQLTRTCLCGHARQVHRMDAPHACSACGCFGFIAHEFGEECAPVIDATHVPSLATLAARELDRLEREFWERCFLKKLKRHSPDYAEQLADEALGIWRKRYGMYRTGGR